jgi:hypothetical protein
MGNRTSLFSTGMGRASARNAGGTGSGVSRLMAVLLAVLTVSTDSGVSLRNTGHEGSTDCAE